jgi:hypothetical protein
MPLGLDLSGLIMIETVFRINNTRYYSSFVTLTKALLYRPGTGTCASTGAPFLCPCVEKLFTCSKLVALAMLKNQI